MMKSLLLCFVVCCCSSGVTGNICCFPPVYEATQNLMKATGELRIHFDGTNRIVSFDENLEVDGIPTKIKVIQDYNSSVKYVITNGHCTRKSLGSFRQGCVPDFAIKKADTFYGDKQDPFAVTLYDNSAGVADSILTVSTHGCLPIMDASAVTHSSADYMQVVAYSNMTIGIEDRSVFNIPASCTDDGVVG